MKIISCSFQTRAGWFMLATALLFGFTLRGVSQISLHPRWEPMAPLYPPGIYVRGTNLICCSTNVAYPSHMLFYTRASTNLTQQMTNWPCVSTNWSDQNGCLLLI